MCTSCSERPRESRVFGVRAPWRLHRDEDGTISILTLFAVVLLVILLGMVMNAGRHVDGKVRMQNAADAAAHSGGVVIARGMNTLAFTNHLLSDVFALTAFFREAHERRSEAFMPPILEAWDNVATLFRRSQFPKFERLGAALHRRVPLEEELIRDYSNWAAAASDLILPVLESILKEEQIPEFQRAVVLTYPDIAQTAAMEAARRNSEPDGGRGEMQGALWRTSGRLVGGPEETFDRTLDVVDPVGDALPDRSEYVSIARRWREDLARDYLARWNRDCLVFFDREARLSRFSTMWRSFTCGELTRLLDEEYRNRNLPHLIRTAAGDVVDPHAHLDEHFTFVGVVYWEKLPELIDFVFQNPIEYDATAYAAVRVFVPRRRLIWAPLGGGGGSGPSTIPVGGVPHDDSGVAVPGEPSPVVGPPSGEQTIRWRVCRQRVVTRWDLFNQSWTTQLVPAVHDNLAIILESDPLVPMPSTEETPEPSEEERAQTSGVQPPNLGGLSGREIQQISPH